MRYGTLIAGFRPIPIQASGLFGSVWDLAAAPQKCAIRACGACKGEFPLASPFASSPLSERATARKLYSRRNTAQLILYNARVPGTPKTNIIIEVAGRIAAAVGRAQADR